MIQTLRQMREHHHGKPTMKVYPFHATDADGTRRVCYLLRYGVDLSGVLGSSKEDRALIRKNVRSGRWTLQEHTITCMPVFDRYFQKIGLVLP